MREVADVLAQNLDLVGVLQEPADGGDLDGALIRQGPEIAPLATGLAAVLPADDDEAATSRHRHGVPCW
jgi:hypothetical protein